MSENRPEGTPPEPEQPAQPWAQQPRDPNHQASQAGQPQSGQWNGPSAYGQGQQPSSPQAPQSQDPYAVRQPPQPTGQSSLYQQPGQPAQPWAQQPYPQPGQPWGQSPSQQQGQPWGVQNPYAQQQAGQPQPGQPWGVQNPYAQQQAGQPQPGQPWGAPNPYGDPYGAPGGGVPEKKHSLAWLWILLGVLALAIVGAVVLIINMLSGAGSGDVYSQCYDGSADACNELYNDSPIGSSDEEFGRTCGGRSGGWQDCNEIDMSVPANSWTETEETEPEGDAAPVGGAQPDVSGRTPLAIDDPNGCMMTGCEVGVEYGDNPRLDNLYDHCEGGNMLACDDLYFLSQSESVYEEMGATCGSPGTNPGVVWCDPQGGERWMD